MIFFFLGCKDAEDVTVVELSEAKVQLAGALKRVRSVVSTNGYYPHRRKPVCTCHMSECYLDSRHEGIVFLRFLDFGLKKQKNKNRIAVSLRGRYRSDSEMFF